MLSQDELEQLYECHRDMTATGKAYYNARTAYMVVAREAVKKIGERNAGVEEDLCMVFEDVAVIFRGNYHSKENPFLFARIIPPTSEIL